GFVYLSPENVHFPPLQPNNTKRGADFQLFGVIDTGLGEPIPTNNQLAVLPYHRVAAHDLLLLGAANTQKTDGSNSSSGGNIGVSLGF
ncbi:hypothetical protein, partial [Yersinia bercovieri]|uniref:hypothetical protein n=1 Tax=Yersinia bercovieri TaxID=634 RepID=UPI00155DB972